MYKFNRSDDRFMYKLLTVFFFLLFAQSALSQKVLDFALITPVEKMPASLTSERSVVVIAYPSRVSWQAEAKIIHRQFIRMGIDPVLYLHYGDFMSSALLTSQFLKLFAEREIKQIILIQINEQETHLAIAKPGETTLFEIMTDGWMCTAPSLNDALFQMALDIKKTEMKRTNFLIAETPDFLETLPILEGNQYPNFPTQLKRVPLAISRFQTVTVDSSIVLNASAQRLLDEYNASVVDRNRQLEVLLSKYPYTYKWVGTETDQELFQKGFQFVLRYVNTSGISAKKMLGYKTDPLETDYLSIIPLPDDKRTLKTIDIKEPIYKFYLKQTVQKDIYVGRYWDADENWEVALENFLTHLSRHLEP